MRRLIPSLLIFSLIVCGLSIDSDAVQLYKSKKMVQVLKDKSNGSKYKK